MKIFNLFKKTEKRSVTFKRDYKGRFAKKAFYSYVDLARDIDNEKPRKVIYVTN